MTRGIVLDGPARSSGYNLSSSDLVSLPTSSINADTRSERPMWFT